MFHPNAELDTRAVSKKMRRTRRDCCAFFANAVVYTFANSVGPWGDGICAAGNSKIVHLLRRIALPCHVLALANKRNGLAISADLEVALATGKYAEESLCEDRRENGWILPAGNWQGANTGGGSCRG